jgi:hypothetical protein
MRTDTTSPVSQATARVRAALDRLARRFATQGVGARWGVAAAALLVLLAVAFAMSGTSVAVPGLVRSGARFSADERIAIGRALDAKHIPYRVSPQGQIEVAADRLDEANEAVVKIDIGRTLTEIEHADLETGLWVTLADKERRAEQAVNDKLAAMIRPMEGVIDAHVMIHRPKLRGSRRQEPSATAFVYLETEDNREVGGATVAAIQALVAAAVPDVRHDRVTVTDRKGIIYVDALNPSLGAQNRTRLYRDELRHEIQDNLDWLKGAQVSVVVDPPAPLPPAAAIASSTPSALAPAPAPPPGSAEAAPEPPPSMSVNQPVELAPATTPEVTVPRAPAFAPSAPVVGPAGEPATPRVRVWVRVPRSFYLRALSSRGEPSLDDLHPLVVRTEQSIRTAVKHVVPADQLESTDISTIPDELPAREPPPAETTGVRRDLTWWVPAGIAAATTVLSLVALGMLATRRPPPRVAAHSSTARSRYKIDPAQDPGPGPSERVRELIRQSPEAAASVLNRWTQGGTIG